MLMLLRLRDTFNPPTNVTNPIGQIHLAKGGNQGYGTYEG